MKRLISSLLLSVVLGAAQIPNAHAKPPNADHPTTHVVYAGQTLGMIAKRYNVSVAALVNANDLRNKKLIKPGLKLIIPARDDSDGSEAKKLREEREAAQEKKASQAETKPAAVKKKVEKAPANGSSKSAKRERDEYAQRPKRRGYLTISGPSGKWRGYALLKNQRVSKSARDGFERVLASWRTGQREPIHGRLIRVLTKVSDHFGGRPIRIVSGYRPYRSSQYTPHSRHNIGRAVDFHIPGVPNEVIRDYCRTLPKVGVGYYPNSSFIHLDVRELSTYWIDYSGPGEAPRYAHQQGKPDNNEGATRPASVKRRIAPEGSKSKEAPRKSGGDT